jgi:predicted  nucleic acid-binding Zn-ribbon protein
VALGSLGEKIMVKKPTIKELEEQMFDLTLQIEHLRSQIYFPVTVEGMELQRTWEDECHVLRSQIYFLKAENEQLESKLDKIARHLAGFK